jgi:hypothetical protein
MFTISYNGGLYTSADAIDADEARSMIIANLKKGDPFWINLVPAEDQENAVTASLLITPGVPLTVLVTA